MKLLLISRCPPYPLHLGDRLIPYHLSRQLAARDHQIDLLAFYNRAEDPDEIDHYRAHFRSVQLIPEPSRSQSSYLARLTGLQPFFPSQAQQAWSPEMWRAIEAKLAAESYDVVQLFGGIQVYEYRDLLSKVQAVPEATTDLKTGTRLCSICYNVTESDPCVICQDPARDHTLVAVVEAPLDVLALERAGSFKGIYHVLHGVISPREGIFQEHLKIKELVQRVQKGGIKEVIICTNPRFEGDMTAATILQELGRIRAEHPVKMTILARGLPTGTAASVGAGQASPVIVPYESYSLYLERHIQQASGIGKLLGWLQFAAARSFERRMFSGYGAVVVLTDKDRDTLHSLNPAYPLHVIPNGIDTEYFVPSSEPPDPDTLVFVGNFEYPPNVDAALWLLREILPRVQQSRPQARLVLAGNLPPETADILHRARRDAVGDGHDRPLRENLVEITGRVPDVRPYVQQAAVFICPLRMGAGIKNKVLEAMAMGKAIVATPLSCDGIEVQAGVQVSFGENADALAKGVLDLLNDPDRCARMGRANRKFVEGRFTWRYVADQYETLYRRLIER